MPVSEMVPAIAYRTTRTVLGVTARVYFRTLQIRDVDRVPARGPLLVVANHPASFTDVIVLGAALPRRLHFLAMAAIFKPWIRGFGLRLCGTLPIYRKQDDPTLMHRNEDTFRACHELLDHGGAVLIFPEGTSLTDRKVVPLKTGAARIALGQERRPGQRGRLHLLPVGLHFTDRTRFGSSAAVSVGPPIELSPFSELAASDEPEAVRRLTAHIQAALEGLILNVPELDQAGLVHAITEIYRGDQVAAIPGNAGLDVARDVAEVVEYYSVHDPARIALANDRVRNYLTELEALRLEDRTVREMLPAHGRIPERLRLVGLGLLGLCPALIGALVHFVPYRLSGAAGRLTTDPTRIASYRIAVALVVFPLTYAGLGLVLHGGLGWSLPVVILALVAAVPLGVHALLYFDWLARQSRRVRLVLFKMSNRRRIARLRQRRLEIIRLCDASRRDFLAAEARDDAVP